MSAARDAILEAARQARRTIWLPPSPPTQDLPREPPAGPEARLERFRAELTSLGVESHVEDAEDAVCARVAALIAGRRVLSWDADRLPYGIGSVLDGTVRGRDPRESQAAAEIGLTGADAAIAETGSLVLLSGPGKARTVSLLPPVHVAVLRRSSIYSTMGDFFAAEAGAIGASAGCTIITGPSRTADIELTLTLGVHGPGEVVVVVGP